MEYTSANQTQMCFHYDLAVLGKTEEEMLAEYGELLVQYGYVFISVTPSGDFRYEKDGYKVFIGVDEGFIVRPFRVRISPLSP